METLLKMIEGDRNGWHIRLMKKLGDVETWSLYYKNTPKSTETTKDFALQWLEQEKKKEGRG